MGFIKDIIISMRPRQWTKNLVIFAALLFSRHIFEMDFFLLSLEGFGLFCLVSGCVYLFNDVLDVKHDKTHPIKKRRPVASGRITKPQALVVSAAGQIIAITISFLTRLEFGMVVLTYIVIQALYSLVLKRVVLVDVFVIAFGFVIRAAAGAYIIHVVISPWLLVCTLLLSLFLALSKRRHEVAMIKEGADARSVLSFYSIAMLDQMINIVGSGTVITYALYTMAPGTVAKFGTDKLVFTVPFVLFGVFRYLLLVHKKMEGGSPEKVLLTDIPLMIDIILYSITSAVIIYIHG